MSQRTRNRAKATSLLGTAMIIGVLLPLCLSLFSFTGSGDWLEVSTSHRLELYFRTLMKLQPKLSPRLKLLVYDDRTVERLGKAQLHYSEWASVLRQIDKRSPKMIMIDKVFGVHTHDKKPQTFAEAAGDLQAKLVLGAFLSGRRIAGRSLITADQLLPKIETSPMPAWFRRTPRLLYGPDPSIVEKVPYLGHLNYTGGGAISPVWAPNQDTIVPHFFLHASDSFSFASSGIKINESEVKLDRFNRLALNLAPLSRYLQHSYSMGEVVERSLSGRPLPIIEAGDTVLILPSFYTGHSDWFETAAGRYPGGILISSLVNSTLTGEWITVRGSVVAGICILSWLGLYLAGSLSASAFSVLLGVVSFALPVSGLLSFSLYSMRLPWFYWLVSFVSSALLLYMQRSRQFEKEAQTIRHALTGLISTDMVQRIVADPQVVNFEPKTKVVTVLAVEVVGFNEVSETMAAASSFHLLRSEMQRIMAKIHANDGMITNMSEGWLTASFGFEWFRSKTNSQGDLWHVEKAVRTAIEIQNVQLKANERSKSNPPFPIRIGIETMSVTLGNLGQEPRIHLSMVGRNLEVPKRLAQIVGDYCIAIGSNANALLVDPGIRAMNVTSLSPSKRFLCGNEGFELDPFEGFSAREKLVQQFRSHFDIDTAEARHLVPSWLGLAIEVDTQPAEVLEFSSHGLTVLNRLPLAKNAKLQVRFVDIPPLQEKVFEVEVRWSIAEGDVYRHSVSFSNLAEPERSELESTLLSFTAKSVPESA